MTLELTELTQADFDAVWEIMEDSFVIEERRTREGQQRLLAESCYHLYGYHRDGELAAFFAVWEFDTFSFLEHFAVKQVHRNGGIGGALLQKLLLQVKSPMILEVELPDAELQMRRIRFYERNGFGLNTYEYVQPSLNEESGELPLMIMSYPKKLKETEFERMRDVLYREAYKVKGREER